MANFDRSYHQNIIINRIDITSKYGLRFVTIDKDSRGNLYKGADFDGCPGGLIKYYNYNAKIV